MCFTPLIYTINYQFSTFPFTHAIIQTHDWANLGNGCAITDMSTHTHTQTDK